MEIKTLSTFTLRKSEGLLKENFPTKCDTVYSPPQGKEHKRCSFSERVHAHPLIYAATILYVNANHPWMPRQISQLPVSIVCMCLLDCMFNSVSAPSWKIKKTSMSSWKKCGTILHTSSQVRLQYVLRRNSSWIKTALLYSDVVDTEVLGAAQTQAAAWL